MPGAPLGMVTVTELERNVWGLLVALLLPALFGCKRPRGWQGMAGDATAVATQPLQIGFLT